MFTLVGSEKDPEIADQLILVPRPEMTAEKLVLSPSQSVKSPIGSMLGASRTTIVIEALPAHSSGLGVNVYVVVLKLLGAGDHEPSIPFKLVFGRFMGSPSQT